MKFKPIPAAIYLELDAVYPKEDYQDRYQYIRKYSRRTLLTFFSLLNNSNPDQLHIDYSYEGQLKLIDRVIENQVLIRKRLEGPIRRILEKDATPLIFHRTACLVAMEEILASDLPETDSDEPKTEDLFKYCLSINSLISRSEEKENLVRNENVTTFEQVISNGIGANELSYPIFGGEDAIRSLYLIEFLADNEVLQETYLEYKDTLRYDPKIFTVWLIRLFFNLQSLPENQILMLEPGNEQDEYWYSMLSEKNSLRSKSILEVLNVKKSPFYRISESKYLLLDKALLIDKCYYSFTNDFFFDFLKSKNIRRDTYKSQLGNFFEKYVAERIYSCFEALNHPKPKCLDELKITLEQGEIEVADFYVRHNKKVLVGQVKISELNSVDKFSLSATEFMNIGQDAFYGKYGLNQLIDISIKNIVNNPLLFDNKFPIGKRVEVYPVLLFNDRVLRTPVMGYVFQNYFQKRIADAFGIELPDHPLLDLVINKIVIKPVILISIGDLDFLEPHLKKDHKLIWKILKFHIGNSSLQPPFTDSLLKKIRTIDMRYLFERAKPLLKRLESEEE